MRGEGWKKRVRGEEGRGKKEGRGGKSEVLRVKEKRGNSKELTVSSQRTVRLSLSQLGKGQ